MVNTSLNVGSLLGIILAFAGVGLYFLRSFRPNLARDYDVFFAAVALLCGGILFFQSWRLDPILQFGVFLLSGSTIFFAGDSIRLRGIATEQAKRNTPIVDEERPVSRVYRYEAELDNNSYGYDYDSFEERQPVARRIRGSQDSVSPGYGEAYGENPYRPTNDRSSSARRSSSSGRRSRRPGSGPSPDSGNAYGGDTPNAYGDDYAEPYRPSGNNDRPSRRRPRTKPQRDSSGDAPREPYRDSPYGGATTTDRDTYPESYGRDSRGADYGADYGISNTPADHYGETPRRDLETPSPRRPRKSRYPYPRSGGEGSAPVNPGDGSDYVAYRPLDAGDQGDNYDEVDNSVQFDR